MKKFIISFITLSLFLFNGNSQNNTFEKYLKQKIYLESAANNLDINNFNAAIHYYRKAKNITKVSDYDQYNLSIAYLKANKINSMYRNLKSISVDNLKFYYYKQDTTNNNLLYDLKNDTNFNEIKHTKHWKKFMISVEKKSMIAFNETDTSLLNFYRNLNNLDQKYRIYTKDSSWLMYSDIFKYIEEKKYDSLIKIQWYLDSFITDTLKKITLIDGYPSQDMAYYYLNAINFHFDSESINFFSPYWVQLCKTNKFNWGDLRYIYKRQLPNITIMDSLELSNIYLYNNNNNNKRIKIDESIYLYAILDNLGYSNIQFEIVMHYYGKHNLVEQNQIGLSLTNQLREFYKKQNDTTNQASFKFVYHCTKNKRNKCLFYYKPLKYY